jgi:hypothetical protein
VDQLLNLVTVLPDGGRVEVTDPEIVAMGPDAAHRQLTYSHNGDDSRPACRIVFEVRGAVPMCVSMCLWSPAGGGAVRTKHLKALRLDDLRDEVYAAAGVFTRNAAGRVMRKLGPLPYQQDRERVKEATGRRSALTPEFLGRVADLYNGADGGARVAAITAAFRVHERQAYRYIAAARAKGLING